MSVRSFPGIRRARGQSVVEFALVLPLLLVMLVTIADFAHVCTTMLSVESAACSMRAGRSVSADGASWAGSQGRAFHSTRA